MFVKRAAAKSRLDGVWKEAMAVQVLVALADLFLFTAVWWLPGPTVAVTACVLLIDLLMISPLKAGRALYFKLLADGKAVSPALLLRYYHGGYAAAVGWRALLWGERLLWGALCCFPALAVFSCSDMLGSDTPTRREAVLSMALFALGLLLLLLGLLMVEVLLFRRLPIPYLLSSQPRGLRGAIRSANAITQGRLGNWVYFYLDHAGGLLLCVLLFPWVYTSTVFQTAKAATVLQFLRQKPAKNAPYRLQHQKKCGRMGR